MILNTTGQDNYHQNPLTLYMGFDPKYLYPKYCNGGSSGSYRHPVALQHNDSPEFNIEGFMEQRRDIVHKKIHMVISDIYQRYQLKNENLYQISHDQCACRNLIYDMGANTWDQKRVEFERKIIDLEQEKRREQTSYFRDILFLKKELRESLIEKVEEENKAEFFTNEMEEST